jgi:hypothetical protein
MSVSHRTSSFAAWLKEWQAEHRAARERLELATGRLRAQLGDSPLLLEYGDAAGHVAHLGSLHRDEVPVAHLPALAPAIRAVLRHMRELNLGDELDCCAPPDLTDL